jgi:hypothetical protein
MTGHHCDKYADSLVEINESTKKVEKISSGQDLKTPNGLFFGRV